VCVRARSRVRACVRKCARMGECVLCVYCWCIWMCALVSVCLFVRMFMHVITPPQIVKSAEPAFAAALGVSFYNKKVPPTPAAAAASLRPLSLFLFLAGQPPPAPGRASKHPLMRRAFRSCEGLSPHAKGFPHFQLRAAWQEAYTGVSRPGGGDTRVSIK
jgi:hypothetical protein